MPDNARGPTPDAPAEPASKAPPGRGPVPKGGRLEEREANNAAKTDKARRNPDTGAHADTPDPFEDQSMS